jgi:DNA repair photolyase
MIYSGAMARIDYTEITCASALNRVSGMPFRWSLNPYRGCVHGCHYCYARATHPYLGFNADEEFETRVLVKTNIPEVLRRELGRSSWIRERVAIGTATDAYQPCEGRYRLTRRILETVLDHQTPVSIVTKSTLIVRDLDLLANLTRSAGAMIFFTITTLEPDLWRRIEPGTPPPLKRLAILRRLREAGVPAGVFLAPILPGITDAVESIDAVAAAAKAHGAVSFGASTLRLVPLVKEHYLTLVAARFPHLIPRYERAYSGVNAPAAYKSAIEERVARIREQHGFAGDAMRARRSEASTSGMRVKPTRVGTGQLVLPL